MSVGKYVMTKSKSWSGLTLKNHIGAIFGAQPQLASELTTVLLQNSGMKNLDTTLSMFPEKVLETSDDFIWKVVGSEERNIPLVEARYAGAVVQSSDANVGTGRGIIELVFPEKYFSNVHIIGGNNPDTYQFRLISDAQEEGGNVVYQAEVFGGQETLNGVPGSELVAGVRFSIESSYVEDELSIRGSDIQFTSPYVLRNSVSTLRFEHKVSGAMIDVKVKPVFFAGIETRDPKSGKVHKSVTWMQEVYWQFEKTISKLKARTLMFGKTNRDANGRYLTQGESGITIKTGSGIREQMEVSNTTSYNKFSIRLLEDLLSELSEGKLDWGERKFMLRTGERGAAQFNRAVTKEASGWLAIGFHNTNTHGIQKVSSKFHDNAYSAGFQFTEWKAPNNIHVMLEVDPMYDDKVRNKILHPDGGVAESYRYDILYIGSTEEPNIQKIKIRNSDEIRGYMAGFRNPFTGQRGGIMQHMEDSATMTAYVQTGSMVKDASRTATLKPTIQG
tara:strand:- start:76972 stop:78480 length:1509 start_codon:yes stop_codon:yes gene_type:complete